MIKIDPEKIGGLIGPGGKMIKSIIAQTGAQVDVEDDGSVSISAVEEEAVNKAVEWIEGLTHEVKPGEEYEGTVKRMMAFGAFVEILPGKEGLVHVSEMSTDYVEKPEDVVALDQKVRVRVKEIDDQGRLNLSMKFGEDVDKLSPRPEGGPGRLGGGMRRDDSRGPRSFDRAPFDSTQGRQGNRDDDRRGGGRSFGGSSSGSPRRSFGGGSRRSSGQAKEKQYEGGRRDDWNR